jgi:hypothetical protein
MAEDAGDLAQLSILLPSLSNSPCVKLCKELLSKNTNPPFEIVEVVDCLNVYEAYNRAAASANGDVLVFLNDDMFVAPGWSDLLRQATRPKTIVTTYLVESGRIPVNYRNIERDFGRTPGDFRYDDFVRFAAQEGPALPPECPGFGWYMPFAVQRADFIPFATDRGRGEPCDFLLFGLFSRLQYEFVRARSFAYHLQKMSW